MLPHPRLTPPELKRWLESDFGLLPVSILKQGLNGVGSN